MFLQELLLRKQKFHSDQLSRFSEIFKTQFLFKSIENLSWSFKIASISSFISSTFKTKACRNWQRGQRSNWRAKWGSGTLFFIFHLSASPTNASDHSANEHKCVSVELFKFLSQMGASRLCLQISQPICWPFAGYDRERKKAINFAL